MESLEDGLFDEQARTGVVQRRTYQIRKDLVDPPGTLPMREVVNAVLRHRRETQRHSGATDLNSCTTTCTTTSCGSRMDRIAARHGHHHLRNQPVATGRPAEHGDEELTSWAAIIAVPTASPAISGRTSLPGFGQNWGFTLSPRRPSSSSRPPCTLLVPPQGLALTPTRASVEGTEGTRRAPDRMIRGTVVTQRRRCGEPNCRCTRGAARIDRLSYAEAGRSRTVPRIIRGRARSRVVRPLSSHGAPERSLDAPGGRSATGSGEVSGTLNSPDGPPRRERAHPLGA